MFEGALVALVTPFDFQMKVDYELLEKLIIFQINSGIQGIVICSSTGEGLSLTKEERNKIIKLTTNIVNGKIPVLAGCSCSSIQNAIDEIKETQDLSLDGVLIPPPFYIKPTQKGIIEYYEKIIEKTELPIIIYNIPSRCSVNINLETLYILLSYDRIVGIKESTRDFEKVTMLHNKYPKLTILSGDDATLPACLAHGASGSISALANICPQLILDIINLWKESDIKRFQEKIPELIILSKALSVTTNPISLKYLAKYKNINLGYSRIPLTTISELDAKIIDNIMI